MSYKENSVLSWQMNIFYPNIRKKADLHFCKRQCFKNLCQTIQPM